MLGARVIELRSLTDHDRAGAMTITDLMSVRFGISLTFLGVVLHKFAETVDR